MSRQAKFRDPHPKRNSSKQIEWIVRRITSIIQPFGQSGNTEKLDLDDKGSAQYTWKMTLIASWEEWGNRWLIGHSNDFWLYPEGDGVYKISGRYCSQSEIDGIKNTIVKLLHLEDYKESDVSVNYYESTFQVEP